MTQTENGRVDSEFTVEVEDGPRRYDPRFLTPRDMRRAKAGIHEVLAGRSPYEMLEDDEDRVPFTIWCLESRSKPGFSWDDALDTPYMNEWKGGEPGPPQIAAPPAGGVRNAAPGSSRKRNGPAPAPSSASSTG